MLKWTIQLFSFYLLFLAGCSPKYVKYVSKDELGNRQNSPDYADLFYWAAHPEKHDPSDSISTALHALGSRSLDADVFFIHPTTLTDDKDSSWNADLTDKNLNAKTDYSSILYQASVFNECRVFAPRYRQAHFRCYFTADTMRAQQAFNLAYSDVRAAFLFYLRNYNKGRPIIIASHSQGSTHAQRLLKEFFENQALKNQLVAAYIPGMYLAEDRFTALKPCTDSSQTGCILSWRTYKAGYEPGFLQKEIKPAVVTNPLSWKISHEHVSYSENLGAIISNFNTLRPKICDAEIHQGILWINRPRIPGSIFLRIKNFHIGDINLFYLNIRTNVRTRVANFLASTK